jgi:hypothetical protein
LLLKFIGFCKLCGYSLFFLFLSEKKPPLMQVIQFIRHLRHNSIN